MVSYISMSQLITHRILILAKALTLNSHHVGLTEIPALDHFHQLPCMRVIYLQAGLFSCVCNMRGYQNRVPYSLHIPLLLFAHLWTSPIHLSLFSVESCSLNPASSTPPKSHTYL